MKSMTLAATLALLVAAPLPSFAVTPLTTSLKASDTIRADLTETWVVPPVVASGARLPAPSGYPVHWQINGRKAKTDVLLNSREEAISVTLTGTLTLPDGGSIVKTFQVRVLGTDSQTLISYSRTPTDVHDANQPVIAHSVHLALGQTDTDAVPLNDNYGIVFAMGEYTAVDRVSLRGLSDPSLFYFADGSLGLIARRVQMSGEADETSASSALILKSNTADPASLEEFGLLDLQTTDGVLAPKAVWDSAERHYLVSWTDKNGAPHWTTVADLARTERRPAEFFPETGGLRSSIKSVGNVGEVHTGPLMSVKSTVPASTMAHIPDAETATSLPIDGPLAAALRNRYGRIVNIGSSVSPRSILAGDIADLVNTPAQLQYSDGSTATRRVDWDAGDLQHLATSGPGVYTVHGTVRQPAYPQIFAYNRADPTIYRYEHDGRVRYLFIATDDTNNNNVGSVHLPIRVADHITDLADANGGRALEVDLLNRLTQKDRTTEGRVIAGCYWAPELHEIGGRLSILFAPCFNPRDDTSNENGLWSTVESHVMQLRDGGDPSNPADWSKPAAVRKADGSKLGRPEYPNNISLDMSYFEVNGQGYYIWSQRYLPESGPLGDPLTWIAKVDPASPTRLASAPVPLIAPNRSVEENLAEGGFAIFHDDRIDIAYSSSSVSPTYVVNGIWAKAGADLMDMNNWHKWTAPLQKSDAMPAGTTDYQTYEQGPGHGAFTTDEDGNELYVYHTWGNGVGGNGRDTRVRRVHWAADGRPVLDMRPDEEVAPAYRSVTLIVTVKPSPASP